MTVRIVDYKTAGGVGLKRALYQNILFIDTQSHTSEAPLVGNLYLIPKQYKT